MSPPRESLGLSGRFRREKSGNGKRDDGEARQRLPVDSSRAPPELRDLGECGLVLDRDVPRLRDSDSDQGMMREDVRLA